MQTLPPPQEQSQKMFPEGGSEPGLSGKERVPNHRSSAVVCFAHQNLKSIGDPGSNSSGSTIGQKPIQTLVIGGSFS